MMPGLAAEHGEKNTVMIDATYLKPHRTASNPGTGVISDLTGGDKEADRAALAVAYGMQLGVHASLGATDQTTPFTKTAQSCPSSNLMVLQSHPPKWSFAAR